MNQSYWKSPSFWYGIYYGVGVFVLGLLLYLIDLNLTSSVWYRVLSILLLPCFVMSLSSIHQKNWQESNAYPYGKAFLSAFLTGVIGTLTGFILSFIFIKISPEYLEAIKEISEEKQIEQFREMGQSEEQIQISLEKGREFMDKMGGYLGMTIIFQGFFILLQALYAAIIAIFTRNKVEEQTDIL